MLFLRLWPQEFCEAFLPGRFFARLRRPRQCLGRRVSFVLLSALLAQRLGLLLQEALEPRTGGRVIQGEVDGGL